MIETIFKFLLASDLIWAALVSVYVVIAVPICYLIVKKRENK